MRVSWLCQGSAKLIQHNVFAPKGHEEQLALPIDNAHISVALRARRCSIVPPKGTIRILRWSISLYMPTGLKGSSPLTIYAASLPRRGKNNVFAPSGHEERASLPQRGKSNICPKGPLRGNEQGGPSGPRGSSQSPSGHIMRPLRAPLGRNICPEQRRPFGLCSPLWGLPPAPKGAGRGLSDKKAAGPLWAYIAKRQLKVYIN